MENTTEKGFAHTLSNKNECVTTMDEEKIEQISDETLDNCQSKSTVKDIIDGNNDEELDKCGCVGDSTNQKASLCLEEENKRLKDEILRVHAEMDNSRKRLQRLFEDKTTEKIKNIILDIVDLLDNFNRAIETTEGSNQSNDKAPLVAIVEGIRMIETQFLQTLSSKWGVQPYASINKEFDPNMHEAMMKEESEGVPSPTVIEEYTKGYMLHEKVLRPAKVKVAVPQEKNKK